MYYPQLGLGVGLRVVAVSCLPGGGGGARRRSCSPDLLLFRGLSSAPPPWVRTRTSRRTVAAVEDDEDEFTVDLDPDDFEDADDGSPSPWEGALVYRRDAAVQHLEYATSLERLGLGDLSSPDSRARAAAMGILSSKPAADQQADTPVLVSVDVTRRRGRLRLDGIVRTVITLGCFRCAEPAPEGIFANFSLLLTEDPVEEPDVIDLGTIYEEDDVVAKAPSHDEIDDDGDVDWDDRLHFPAGDKEIDISKHIRDVIHLEITFDAFCSPTCKGLCLVCGTNLNTSTCTCSKERPSSEPSKDDAKRRGPLKELLRPLQQHR